MNLTFNQLPSIGEISRANCGSAVSSCFHCGNPTNLCHETQDVRCEDCPLAESASNRGGVTLSKSGDGLALNAHRTSSLAECVVELAENVFRGALIA
jgi:hypothetical protein